MSDQESTNTKTYKNQCKSVIAGFLNSDNLVAIVKYSVDGLVLIDMDGLIRFVNPSAEKLLNAGYDELVGNYFGFPMVPNENAEIELISKNGNILIVEMRITNTKCNGEDMFLASLHDITDRKKYEMKYKELMAELEAKNQELEEFTYTVSHDLKGPLITIKGFLGVLESEIDKTRSDESLSCINHIHSATDKMSHLLEHLLNLSRIGRITNPPQKVPFFELAHEAAELVLSSSPKHNLKIDISPDLPVISCDRQRMLEVMNNLLSNAFKNMGNQTNPHIEIGVLNDIDERIIYVRDNGKGIKPEYHKTIFRLFEKMDADSDGTGIGLAIVKRIIEAHNGRVWVESEGLGKGSTFCFVISEQTSYLKNE